MIFKRNLRRGHISSTFLQQYTPNISLPSGIWKILSAKENSFKEEIKKKDRSV